MAHATHSGNEPGGREPAPGRLRLVQAFLNSVDLEDGHEAFGSVAGLHDWIVAHGLVGAELRIAEGDRERAILLREGLRDLLAAHTGEPVPADARDHVNAVLEGASLSVRFAEDGPGLQSMASGIDGVFGQLAAIVHAAAIDGTWARLKTCRNDVCRWAFYDTSKNRSGTWCSMAICGSKLKARSYRQRQRREP